MQITLFHYCCLCILFTFILVVFVAAFLFTCLSIFYACTEYHLCIYYFPDRAGTSGTNQETLHIEMRWSVKKPTYLTIFAYFNLYDPSSKKKCSHPNYLFWCSFRGPCENITLNFITSKIWKMIRIFPE